MFTWVIEALTKLQESRLEADYPTRIILLSAWVRLRVYLGEDFLPYLPFVIRTVLQSAQLNLDSTIRSTDTSDESRTVSHEDKRKGIQISDSRLREKTFACDILGYYADELKEAFFPWIDEVATVLVPLLRFDHEIVREAAFAAMPKLLRSAKLAIRKGQAEGHIRYSSLKQLTDQMVAALLNFLPKEPNVKIRLNKLETLRTCIQICASVLDEKQIGSIVEEMKQLIGTSTSVEDEDLRENENEQEHGYLHQGSYVTVEERKLAICIWGDVVENCRNSVLRYNSMCLPFLLDACIDENQEVRQLAVYVLGLCAEYGGSVFRPAVREAVSRLTKVIGNPHTRHAESVLTNDYAVLVLGKICQFQHDSVDGNQVIPFWLDCLPIRGNVSEAKVVHEQLCSMVESFGEAIMGSNNQNLPKIVRVVVEVLHGKEDLATKQTASRMVNFLKQIQQTLLPSALSALQPEQRRLLESVLSS